MEVYFGCGFYLMCKILIYINEDYVFRKILFWIESKGEKKYIYICVYEIY